MDPRLKPRLGTEDLAEHLNDTYGTQIENVTELDLGTYRIDHRDHQDTPWIARLHPATRPPSQAEGDAEILAELERHDYPAERLAASDPVSTLYGQALVVTEFVTPAPHRREAVVKAGGLRALGGLLARLQTLDATTTRPGGAWHHLADGAPSAEIAVATQMLQDAQPAPHERSTYEHPESALADADAGEGLPEALVHPDFVMRNVVASQDRGMVLIDWSGAGRGPRIWSLAFLLWSVGAGGDLARVDRTIDGYQKRIALEPEELRRLPNMIAARPVVFDVWAYATGRKDLVKAAAGVAKTVDTARAIGARALSR